MKWLLLLLLAPMASAGTSTDPELLDPEGDANLRSQGGAAPVYGHAIDLRAVWFQSDAEGLAVGIQVEDLGALDMVYAGQLQWAVRFGTAYQNASGAADRIGDWTLRAYYVADTAPGWGFMLERPCKDGDGTDGCAGEDRDILEATGLVLADENIIWMFADRKDLAGPQWGDGIHALHATAQAQVPTTATAFEDWDQDEAGQCHFLAQTGTLPIRAAGLTPATKSSSNGLNGRAGSIDETDVCAEQRDDFLAVADIDVPRSSPPIAVTNQTQDPADAPAEPKTENQEAPGPATLFLGVAVTLVALRHARRRS